MKLLKSLTLTLLIVFSSLHSAFSQTKGQLTTLQEVGDGSVFTEYYSVTNNGGSWSAEKGSNCDIKFENNIHNKFSTFILNKSGTSTVLINCGFGFLKPNHYTEPSVFYSKTHKMAYVYIDGLLYTLKKISAPQNISSFTIENIYALSKPAKGEHTSGKAAIKELKSRDHEAVIKKYLTDMKAVQETATAAFSPEIKAEIDAVEGKAVADQKAIKDMNDAYWTSAEGQKKLGEMRQEEVTLVNDTGGDIGCCYGQGVSNILKPGEKRKFSCHSGKVYLGDKVPNSVNLKRTDKLLLDLHGNNCGTTVTVSSVLR